VGFEHWGLILPFGVLIYLPSRFVGAKKTSGKGYIINPFHLQKRANPFQETP